MLLDVSNPLDFSQGFPPSLFVKDTDSLAEQIQRAFPDARVVKSLNTMTAAVMVDPGRVGGGDHSVFVSGDDADAKQTVVDLLAELRAHRRHRPRRPVDGARRRDAAAGVAAPDGRAGHAVLQLQDRPLSDGGGRPCRS